MILVNLLALCYVAGTYFSCFMYCYSCTHEATLFQNIFKFCTFLPQCQMFYPPFFARFLKIACMPLLSRISPGCSFQREYTSLVFISLNQLQTCITLSPPFYIFGILLSSNHCLCVISERICNYVVNQRN